MFNLGAGEVLVIMLLALIVLGPQRLPDAARQIGKAMGDIKRLSSGFQQELKTAFDEEAESTARSRGAALVAEQPPTPQPDALVLDPVDDDPADDPADPADPADPGAPVDDDGDATGDAG